MDERINKLEERINKMGERIEALGLKIQKKIDEIKNVPPVLTNDTFLAYKYKCNRCEYDFYEMTKREGVKCPKCV